LKGLTDPIRASEVVYERNDPVALLNQTPFVGRATQLKKLVSKLSQALNGIGAIAMVRGEPGIGKTRMLEEFADRARQESALVLRGACYDGEWQRPYSPFAEAIADYSHLASPDELVRTLTDRSAILSRIAPSLRDIFDDRAEPAALDKDEERFRLF